MKRLKFVLILIFTLTAILFLVFFAYRVANSEAKVISGGIEYNEKIYNKFRLNELPENYFMENVNYSKAIQCGTLIQTPLYAFHNDNALGALFEEDHSALGPSLGWVYIREDYVFPTIHNSEVISIELESTESINITEQETIDVVVSYIKNHDDISLLFPIEEYGLYGLNIHYKDSPVYEKIGGVWNEKYMYNDEYWEWTKTKEYEEWVNS